MTFQVANVHKPLLDVSRVIDKGNIVVFDGNGSFTSPGKCPGAAFVEKGCCKGPGRIPLHAKKEVFVMRTRHRWVSVGRELLQRTEHQAEQA